MDAPIRAASRGRPPHSAPHPEMAEGGSAGGRRVEGDGDGDAARGGDFTPAGEYLSALRLRSLGAGVEETRARRRGRRALRGRHGAGIPGADGSGPLPGGLPGTAAEVWAGTASGENAPD